MDADSFLVRPGDSLSVYILSHRATNSILSLGRIFAIKSRSITYFYALTERQARVGASAWHACF
jgi:hypothetical protein